MRRLFLALLALTALALAEPHSHDGFFMNYAFGAGYQDFESGRSKSNHVEISGVSSEFDLKLGLALNPALIIHLTLFDVSNQNDIEYNGSTLDFDGISSILLGVGVTHYTPSNIFFSFTVGVVQVSPFDDAEFDFKDENHGIGIQAEAGKELWISDNWAFGAALSLTYIRSSEQNISQSALGINILLSLTYN